MITKPKVFFSFIEEDLAEDRNQLFEAVERLGLDIIGMERFNESCTDPELVAMLAIGEADVFVIIVGEAYISIASKGMMSYLQTEFKHAVNADKPIFSYFKKTLEQVEGDYSQVNNLAIAYCQLKMAKGMKEDYRFRSIVPSMAFSVFRVEALCNLYGSQLFPHWEHFESMSLIGKIAMISEFLKIEVDFSREPWQTLNQMKKFRNALVHAKPQKASDTHDVPEAFPEEFLPFPPLRKSISSLFVDRECRKVL